MASLSVDEDLDKAWARTLDQCQEITKWNLKSTGRAIDVDNIIDKIQPKSKEPELKDKAKDYLGRTLLCLQKFGSVIAQATSAVFGPSQQVMNGISFLIDATQEYGKVFSGFVTIMERISAFLGRLKVYLDEKAPAGTPVLDKRLQSDVYEVLHHFILVLAHSHKLATSKMARAKLMAGLLFFGDDQGVKESLANLEFKIANVSRMEITVILQKVSEEARNVRRVEQKIDVIVDGVTRIEASFLAEQDHRLTKEQNEQNARRLKETLQPDGPEAWVDVHNSLQSQIVASTGSWLLEKHAAFQRWTNPKENSPPVFVLSGGEGYGKSCLSSAVIHHLLDKYPKGRSDHRVAVAYYYFRRDSKEKSSVTKAIRDVLYQLTQYDTAYAKKVGSAITASQDLGKPMDLWTAFVKNVSNRANNTFFIVLDGIDEPESEEGRPLATIIQELMSQKPTEGELQVRLFVSGRPSEIQKIEDRSSVSIPEVSLGSKPGSDNLPINQTDIVQFVTSRLRDMDIFQTSANDEVSALQDRIPSVLAAGVKGDFVRLGYKLDEISKCTRVRQIARILKRASETRKDAIQRQITSMNSALSRDEIEDLNKILNWVLGAMDVEAIGWVDSECLEGVLLLKTGTPAVVSLAKQIKNKYATLLDLDKQGVVTLVSDDIRLYLFEASRAIEAIQPANNEVQVAEIAIVKRVISTFCGDDLYKRFNFEAFFESMGGEKAAKVQIDEKDIHVKILRTCSAALCEKHDNEGLKSLRDYARLWFAEHLGKVDKKTLDNMTVKWISTQLARLLVEPGPIDAWWNEEYFDELQDDWLDEGSGNDRDAGTEEDVDDSVARTEENDGADDNIQIGTDVSSAGIIDPGVEELFWVSALPGLGHCYLGMGDLNKAAEVYQRVMDYRFNKVEDTVSDDPDDGQYNYLDAVWYKQEKPKAIHALLNSLDRKDNGYTSTRLTGVIQHSATDHDLHEQLRSLVIDTETFDFVNAIYTTASTVDENEHLDRSLALRNYWAMFLWLHGSLADCQERSFEILKEIIETEIPDDADYCCTVQRSYYHLAGDRDRAKSALAKRMRAIFEDWDESSYGFYQHLLLAHTFTALDDDDNALAAWSLLAPYAPEPAVAVHKQNAVTSAMNTANVEADDDDQATLGAQRDSDTHSNSDYQSSNTTGDDQEDQDSDKESSDGPEESSEPSEGALEPYSELYGWLNSSCDGCGSPWSYVDDIYCCKDCLDVQLDKKCYPKLRAAQLDRTICHPKHSFLHVPPFDEAKWRSLVAKDAVEVGGKEMSRLDWLAVVRAACGVERETLEREEQEQSAVTIIGQGWRAYQARRSGT